jgi:broad specificity phosphatase PhoE
LEGESLTRIILIRHGRTAWNEGDGERLRGRSEIELDEDGITQAQAVAVKAAQWEVTAVYSSPLKRAMMTAKIIAEPSRLPVESLPALTDIDYGKWQGLTLKEAATANEALYKLWLKSPEQVKFPGGEGLEEVKQRALKGVEAVATRNAGLTTVLVSHKVVCKVLICSLMGLGLRDFWNVQQDLCALNIVEMSDNGPVIRLVNDTCHLRNPA